MSGAFCHGSLSDGNPIGEMPRQPVAEATWRRSPREFAASGPSAGGSRPVAVAIHLELWELCRGDPRHTWETGTSESQETRPISCAPIPCRVRRGVEPVWPDDGGAALCLQPRPMRTHARATHARGFFAKVRCLMLALAPYARVGMIRELRFAGRLMASQRGATASSPRMPGGGCVRSRIEGFLTLIVDKVVDGQCWRVGEAPQLRS